MTNLQLLLTIGIPSILVILSWISNNTRLSLHDKRLDDLEVRIDKRFSNVDERFSEIDKRFNEVIAAQHRDALEIMRNMTSLHERVAVVEARRAS